MQGAEQYAVYRTVIKHVLTDSERLPSLPTVTLKIRKAISEPNTNALSLAELIGKDPALSALLIKSASSPLYRRAVAPKTLADVVALLGFANVNSLVMIHSVRSLCMVRTPVIEKLFNHTWKRLVIKTSLASFFAQRLGYRPLDEAQLAALLTEVGSLAILASLTEINQTPEPDAYFTLCRHYSKSITSLLLNRWNLDKSFVAVLKQSGQWNETSGDGISLIDIVNLSIYHAVVLTNKNANLPPLESLAAFKKLTEQQRRCIRPNCLAMVTENQGEIQEIVNTFK